MIAFEVLNDHGGVFYPIVVCDHCAARIVGSGNALWITPSIPGGLSIGDRFRLVPSPPPIPLLTSSLPTSTAATSIKASRQW